MIEGSVLQSAQRCFEKKSRVVVKMVITNIHLLTTWERCFMLYLRITRHADTLNGSRGCRVTCIFMAIPYFKIRWVRFNGQWFNVLWAEVRS